MDLFKEIRYRSNSQQLDAAGDALGDDGEPTPGSDGCGHRLLVMLFTHHSVGLVG